MKLQQISFGIFLVELGFLGALLYQLQCAKTGNEEYYMKNLHWYQLLGLHFHSGRSILAELNVSLGMTQSKFDFYEWLPLINVNACVSFVLEYFHKGCME